MRAVVDAAYPIAGDDLGYSDSAFCPPEAEACTYEDVYRTIWDDITQGFWQADVDGSCLAWHAASEDQFRCGEAAHELEHHVTTPMFVRMDTQDELLMGNAVTAGVDLGGVPVDEDLFGRAVHDQLVALADLDLTAEEGGALTTPGVFGPQCGDHETLKSVDYLAVRVEAAAEDRHTGQVLFNWLTGAAPSVAIEPFLGPGTVADCPDAQVIFADGFEIGDVSAWGG